MPIPSFLRRLRWLSLLAAASLELPATAEQVIFTEVMYHPAGDGALPEFIEVKNLTSNRLDMASWRLSGGVDFAFPGFIAGDPTAHFLKEYERILISSASPAATRTAYPGIPATIRVFGPWTGLLDNAGDRIRLSDAAGAMLCELTYGDSGKWPAGADGTGHSLAVRNENRKIDDWRNWRLGLRNGGTPGEVETPSTEKASPGSTEIDVLAFSTMVDYVSPWKYWRDATDPDGASPEGTWKGTGFADGAWPSGNGFFGHEPSTPALSAAIQTSFTSGFVSSTMTYYFRTTFNYSGSLTGTSFTLDQYVDDGVVYWLNGQELKGTNLGRVRMNAGVPTHTTSATGTPPPGDAFDEANVLSGTLDGQLVAGTNVLCAEVHQSGAGSSDIYFGARLRINPPPASVIISEVKPANVPGAGFVEFYNPTGGAIDLNGFYLTDNPANLTKYQIATPVIVPASGYATVGFTESNLAVADPLVIYLTRPDGSTRQAAASIAAPPTDGRSVGRKPPTSNTWFTFVTPTPNAANQSPDFSGLRLSEAHFGPPTGVDWVEFANTSNSPISGSGLFVASRPDFADKTPLPATVPANSHASISVSFPGDAGGDVVLYLIDSLNTVLDTAEIPRRAGLDSVQRWPLSSDEWYAAATATQDAANNPARHDEIVINEIMFALPSRHDQGQFIELYNRSGGTVDLTGWRLVDGMDYDFAPGTTLASGAYLVVAKDPAYITANYGAVANLHGPASGSLRRGGESIRLEDERRNLTDSVDYRAGGDWPEESGGSGSSLELMHPNMDNSQPSSWRASNESTKSTFQSYTHTGLYRELRTGSHLSQANGRPITETKELLLNLVSDGHLVLKNITLASAAAPGTNILTTGAATSHSGSGANGFLCTGTHCLSDTLSNEFHLISTGSGDTKGNKAEVDLTSLAANTNYILSFEARWVAGMPLLVAQTWDRSFGKVFRLPIPNNLGTPGAANSRAVAAPPPTVDSLSHSPKVPTSSQPVVVSAKVSSAAPLASVTLFQRTDSASPVAYTSAAMNDNGTGGDSVAGDGIWSATVAAKGDGQITQFYVQAAASNGQTNELPRNALGVAAVNGSELQVPARPAMWIVDNSPPSAAPGILTERYILAQYDRDSLSTGTGFSATRDYNFPKMSNFGFNCTMIYNESDVLYNCEMRKGGSPWTRDGGNGMTRIRYKPPGDNQWRNRSKSGIDNDAGGANRFHNRNVRYMLHLLGYPIPDSEFVQRIVNADGPGLGDDQEQTDDDFFDRVYPDSDQGDLFEIDDAWYMYDDFENRVNAGEVTGRWVLGDWNPPNASIVAPSEESPIYFHGNWPVRFPEDRYDYAALAQFIKTAYNNNVNVNAQAQITQDAWREQMERQIDVDRAAAYAAARGYIGDWDNFTINRGKNGYFFRRAADGKFEFHHWDSDLGFDQATGVIGGIGGTGFNNLAGAPYFRRYFHYYLTDLQNKINGASSRMAAYLTAINYQSTNPDGLAPFKTNQFNYTTWFSSRNARITTEINSYGGANATRPSTVTTANNQTVAVPLFTLNGEAQSGVWSVDVLNHPEGAFKWTVTSSNAGLWTITGLALANGINNLTVRFLAKDGGVMSTVPFTVTLTGNGPPLARLAVDPASGNLARNEIVDLSGAASSDPEGGALTFSWGVSPASGAVLTPAGSTATARFTVPGVYTVTMNVTDAALNVASASRQFTVYDSVDFLPFSAGAPLPAGYVVQNAEYRDNFSPSTWYSLEDNSGRILIQILDDAARPLNAPAFTFPLITRDLPDTANFALQTEVDPMTREFGNWQAGLWIEMVESGVAVRYSFAIEAGLNLVVRRAPHPANFAQIALSPHTGSGATLRIRRSGNSLLFERRIDTAWSTVHTQSIAAGATAATGGIFSATSQPTSVLTGFDYLLVSDPTNANDLLSSLRITELMYNGAAGWPEFIELRNTGSQAINLSGASFDIGAPIAMLGVPETAYVFGSEILNPGEFLVITDNVASFQARYGNGVRLGAPWTGGGLSNGGERITLRDPFGNTIVATHDFTYDDDAPWPTAADGLGPSLEIIDSNGDYNSFANWRASGEPFGSPGYLGAGPDTDGDGVADSREALFGTDANNAGSTPAATSTRQPSGAIVLNWPSVPNVTYRVEISPDLATWSLLQTVVGAGTWTDLTAPPESRRYYRITAVAP